MSAIAPSLSGNTYYLLCLGVFAVAYLINATYISVFYHRGLAHGAVELRPWLQQFVAKTGIWVTGIDPKAWACMHRLHHEHSDTPQDPHSPLHAGILGVAIAQLRSYERILVQLLKKRPEVTDLVGDLPFNVSWPNRNRVWWLPYALHTAIAVGLGVGLHAWLLGFCLFTGLMSHPVEGWLVNSFAHAVGYRNFETPDNSRNNTLIALLVMGEGYQNNHHQHPASPKFALRAGEIDLGYSVCQILRALNLLTIRGTVPQFADKTNSTMPQVSLHPWADSR